MTGQSYFGIDGKPTLRDGYAGFAQTYDERGNVTGQSTFGIDGEYLDGYGTLKREK